MNNQEQTQVSTSGDETEPDGMLYGIMIKAAAEGVARGLSEEEAVQLATKTLFENIPQLIGPIAASLHQGKADLVAWLDEQRAGLTEAIDRLWGTALTIYDAAAYTAYELGAEVREAYNAGEEGGDTASEVAFRLHGRACAVAGEVLCLMRNGFSDGAIARQRTLHEIAVVMSVILEHPGLDLAERYSDYAIVEQRDDMKTYQQHAATLSQPPFDQDDVDALEQDYQAILQRWGPDFRKKNRWAAPLFPPRSDIQFGMLEKLAGLDHLHPFYRLSNHYVHAGPRAAVMNVYDVRGAKSIGAGARADTDIGEAGHGALISLVQCTASLVTHVPAAKRNPDHLLALMCLQRLLDDAGTAFERSARRR